MARGREAGAPVEIARYRWRHEAEMALGILEDEGIPGAVLADDMGGAYAGIGEARIVVPSSHAERARAVLAELREDAGGE
ncbi:MAG TPA: DUF2007 domain-containing protein, partial [Gemmatimonadota bacterium]|jgi:hypothetical protein|nr:DUF2007 domain-containing protein [Gemmatimonadota bacterium]